MLPLLFVLCYFQLFSQEVPSGGIDILKFQDDIKNKLPQSSFGEVLSVQEKNKFWLSLECYKKTPKPWDVQFYSTQTTSAIENGDALLLVFEAKTLLAEVETAEAVVKFNVTPKQKYAPVLTQLQSIGRAKATYYIPFVSTKSISKEQIQLSIHAGFAKQKLLISNLRLINYKKNVPVNQLPRTEIKYNGMEPDAKWRKAAQARIEKYRKGSIVFKIRSQEGTKIRHAQVSIQMKKHHFGFGSAVAARPLCRNKKYLDKVTQLYNYATLENALTMKTWQWKRKQKNSKEALLLLNNKSIPTRGHVLLWPGFEHLPQKYSFHRDSTKLVINFLEKHIEEITTACKGQVTEWDVVNEASTNNDLQRITGSEQVLFNSFQLANKNDSKVKLFVNESGIISGAGLDQKKQNWYLDYCNRVDKNTNNLLSGIGFQCHMGTSVTSPEKIYTILNRFAQLNKTLSITGFTHNINDQEAQARYLRDFYTIVFSHPKVDKIIAWGFWEGAIKQHDAALYKLNWKPKLNALAYEKLIFDEWWTTATKTSNEKGEANFKVFLGEHTYTVTIGEKIYSGTINTKGNTGITIVNVITE